MLMGAPRIRANSPTMLEFATRDQIRDGRLVEIFPDWPDERFPLYALYSSRGAACFVLIITRSQPASQERGPLLIEGWTSP
jgi:hypothetical protein